MDNAPKLDWMYAGPAGHVDTEEYLTGRAVDKTFEQFKLGGADVGNSDLPAPLLPREKSTVPKMQVDVARKVQEDPLLRIRRQEEERKATLREQFLIQQRLASQGKKTTPSDKPKGCAPKATESYGSSADLDTKLALKLKQLASNRERSKDSLDEKLLSKLKKLKRKQDVSSSSSDSSDDDKRERHEKRRRSPLHKEREVNRYADHRNTDKRDHNRNIQRYAPDSSRSDSRRRSRSPHQPRDRNAKNTVQSGSHSAKGKRTVGLSEEELEKRRKEMMQQAVVRDEERKTKVERYRKEVEAEDKQLNADRPKEAAFVKKQLATATANTTVEARIKANVFHNQRSVHSMDSNFARR